MAQTTTTAAVITTSITILVSLTYDGHVVWNKMLRYVHTIHCIHVIVSMKSDMMLSRHLFLCLSLPRTQQNFWWWLLTWLYTKLNSCQLPEMIMALKNSFYQFRNNVASMTFDIQNQISLSCIRILTRSLQTRPTEYWEIKFTYTKIELQCCNVKLYL